MVALNNRTKKEIVIKQVALKACASKIHYVSLVFLDKSISKAKKTIHF